MKKTILLLLISLFATTAFSQDLFMQLTNKYADKDGFSATKITSDMFGLYLRKKNIEEGAPVYETLKKLDNILVASQNRFVSDDTMAVAALHSEILDYYKKQNYTLFKTEKRLGEDIKVYLKKTNDKVTSLALVTASSSVANLVEMNGDIDLVGLGEVSKALNVRGLENLNKINGSNSYHAWGRSFVSPDFDSNDFDINDFSTDVFSEERLKEFQKQMEAQSRLTDEQRKEFERQAEHIAARSREMAEKSREMEEWYGRKPIFLSTPGDTNVVYYLDGKKVKAEVIKELNSEKIQTVDVSKGDKKGEKNIIRITTKK